jgi:ketosteroid isomerase-like protein
MSERAELTRRGYEAWNRRDWEAMFDLFDADIEWIPVEGGAMFGDSFRGHQRVRDFFEMLFDAWDEFRIELEELIENDDKLLAIVWVRTRGRSSGVEVEERWAHVWTLGENGLALRLQAFDDLAQAREAAGLPPA